MRATTIRNRSNDGQAVGQPETGFSHDAGTAAYITVRATPHAEVARAYSGPVPR